MLLTSALTSFVLLPLYIYPIPGAWDTYYKSIAALPNVTFSVVINPANGPGPAPYPDANFIANIVKLKTYPNVQVLGYVHTVEATRNLLAVEKDIKTYANWATLPHFNISMDGIFFDEAPSKWTTAVGTYMTAVTTTANTAFLLGKPYVTFNPGVQVDPRFYAVADSINAWEGDFGSFTSSAITSIPKGLRKQSTFMIHGFKGTAAEQTSTLKTIYDGGIGGFFISTQDDYDAVSTLWASFVQALAWE